MSNNNGALIASVALVVVGVVVLAKSVKGHISTRKRYAEMKRQHQRVKAMSAIIEDNIERAEQVAGAATDLHDIQQTIIRNGDVVLADGRSAQIAVVEAAARLKRVHDDIGQIQNALTKDAMQTLTEIRTKLQQK